MATATAPKKAVRSDNADRVICLLEGESGSGKSYLLASLKNALIYDTDLGGGLAYAEERIRSNGSERVEMASYPEILADLRIRAANGKLPPTIAIDHITGLHQEALLRFNPSQVSDYGRSGNQATFQWRQVREFIRTFDCNLFVVSHLKGEWDNDKQVGKVADGAKNIEGDMHIVLRLESVKDPKGLKRYPSIAHSVKWRRLPEDPRGMVPPSFPFTLEEFERINGRDYTRERIKVEFAKPESIAKLKAVLEFVGGDRAAELQTKWLQAAAVDKLEELTQAQVEACIDKIQKDMGAK